jgi:hypothetical protein
MKKRELKNKNLIANSSVEGNSYYSRIDNAENPKKLSIEQIRSSEEFANISDEEANEIINSLHELSIITLKIFQLEERSSLK